METTVAAPAPPRQTTLPAQSNAPTQSSSKKKIISAAQESLERAIAAAPPSPIKTDSKTEKSSQHLQNSIVTPHGTWQNVVAPSSPQPALPAVQDFLQKAFETVQRSQKEVLAQNTHQKLITSHPSLNSAPAMISHSQQQSFAIPLSPQTISTTPFYFLQASTPNKSAKVQEPLLKTPPAVVNSLDKSIIAQIEQANVTKSAEHPSASQGGKTSNTGQMRRASTGQTGVTSKAGYSGYTIYNTAWPANPKPRQIQDTSQKRAVLVAKRRQSPTVPKIEESSKASSSGETQTFQSATLSPTSLEKPVFGSSSLQKPGANSSPLQKPRADSSSSEKAGERLSSSQKLEAGLSSSHKSEAGSSSLQKPRADSSSSEKAGDNSSSSQKLQAGLNPSQKPGVGSSSSQKPRADSSSSEKTGDESSSAQNPGSGSSSSEKSQNAQSSSKESPVKSRSRVAQTYQSFKAQKDRGTNGPQASQSPKKNGGHTLEANAGSSRSNNGRRPPPRVEEDDIDPKRRVLVSGFPPYTQAPDLTRVLSKFGKCHIDKCRNRLALVTFDTEEEAKNAMKAADDICIYGDFVEIKPFVSHRHVEELFRAYKKVISTEKGQDIIMPTEIDLTGDFYQQLDNILNAIRLTREQVEAIANLYVDLERVLQQEWPGCVAIPFGSIPTGLGIKSSDADCYVKLPAALQPRGAGGGAAAFVTRARRLLAAYPATFARLVAIPRANTPIVKFLHLPSGFHCDVSAKTPLGAQNTRLLKLLLERDARLAPLAVLLKYWARVHQLSGTGRLTNYALALMLVFYLQQPRVALAPPVARLQREPGALLLVDHWNAGFAPPRPEPAPAPARLALPDLLGGFFAFYAAFDFDELVVCPYLGVAVRKAAFDAPHALPAEFARYAANVRDGLAGPIRHATPFCVQDPFEQSHNVASSVSARLAADIRAYLRFAADAYAAERGAGCPGLLRTLLLARPRLPRDRAAPTTKLFLIPRVRAQLAPEDWRARAKEIVLEMIFERMLRLPLARDLEREAADREEEVEGAAGAGRRIDRERYAGAATKPVWRRKRNYSAQAPEPAAALIARQAAASEEILRAAADAPLEFSLELGFRDEPRHLYVLARLVAGDLDLFRQFVAFLHTSFFDWFRILLRPYQAPPAPLADTAPAADIARDLSAVSLADGPADSEKTAAR